MASDGAETALAGRRILIVEDELIIGMYLESLLEQQRCHVLGPSPSVEAALSLLDRERPDAALLDCNLRGELSTPVAAQLRERGVPFIVVSGYGPQQLGEPQLDDVPWVRKPVDHNELLRQLARLLG